MINDFRDRNIPIDGIGFQMHVDYKLSKTQLEYNAKRITDLGLLLHFSELDMTLNRNKFLTSLTYERALAQEKKYLEISQTYSALPKTQKFGITFWGMRDSDSWLLKHHDNSNEYPLLYNQNYNTKIAHRGFAQGL
jgi:endo-1,4-beta-xylanase